jgi:fucose permease
MSIPAGVLVERYKEKRTMISAFVVAFLGALLFSLFPKVERKEDERSEIAENKFVN